VLAHIGDVLTRLGRYEQAGRQHQAGLALSREIADRHGEACALNGLGETLTAAGRPGEAVARHAEALSIAAEGGDREGHARAHNGLAHAHDALGRDDLAREHWRQALVLYSDLRWPEAAEVQARLSARDQPDGELA
jgi:Flp pilus assembly protein TadD